jgi:tRNA modification GTPase
MADTIFAMASAPGRAAIAVWRISGPSTAQAIRNLTGCALPPARRAALRILVDPASQEPIDQALTLWFPGPASFTGEDSAELHTHGGRAVAEKLGEALGAMAGLRSAEPGEFARRAFINGKLDLTQAEAIADLVAADTDRQRRQAQLQAGGALKALYDGWRTEIIRLRAHLDVALEFPDDDVGDPIAGLGGDIERLRVAVLAHLRDARRGERLREGVTIAVIGAPNAGKSSLVNSLAGRPVAIVSGEPGTTRDAIEVHLDIGGYPVTLVDTAGLREAEGAIEAEGVALSGRRAAAADLVLALFAADAPPDEATLRLCDERAISAVSKTDLAEAKDGAIGFSTRTGVGMAGLLSAIEERVRVVAADGAAAAPSRARHREALAACAAALEAALATESTELAAEELRVAGDALGRLTGRVDVEEVLDAIFRGFCIGK